MPVATIGDVNAGRALDTRTGSSAMLKRRRFKQLTFQDRLSAWVKEVTKKADQLPAGAERDALIKRARQADVAAHLDDWAKSPGLRPPK